jgi:hypothetical protein
MTMNAIKQPNEGRGNVRGARATASCDCGLGSSVARPAIARAGEYVRVGILATADLVV